MATQQLATDRVLLHILFDGCDKHPLESPHTTVVILISVTATFQSLLRSIREIFRDDFFDIQARLKEWERRPGDEFDDANFRIRWVGDSLLPEMVLAR